MQIFQSKSGGGGMAKVYIANKPVRFDKNYNIGEIIPTEVIDPKMTRKLTEMGRIIYTDIPDTDTQNISNDEDIDTPAAKEFICEVCGKTFKSQNALAAHSRSHKD